MAYMCHGSKGSHLEVEGNQQEEDGRMGKKIGGMNRENSNDV